MLKNHIRETRPKSVSDLLPKERCNFHLDPIKWWTPTFELEQHYSGPFFLIPGVCIKDCGLSILDLWLISVPQLLTQPFQLPARPCVCLSGYDPYKFEISNQIQPYLASLTFVYIRFLFKRINFFPFQSRSLLSQAQSYNFNHHFPH